MTAQPATASQNESVALLVGTMKGAFLLRSDEARRKWRLEGPHFQGFAVYAMLHDSRTARSRTYAAANNPFFGSALRASEDYGRSWSEPEQYTIKFPEESGRALKQIWQITPGRSTEPAVLYCGVEPAALFADMRTE